MADDSAIMMQWIASRCTVDADAKGDAAGMYASYLSYCAARQAEPMSPVRFSRAMHAAGVRSLRLKRGRVWWGARLDGARWSWWATAIEHEGERPECYEINETTREAALAVARAEHGDRAIIALVEATQDGPFNVRPFDEKGDCPLVMAIIDQFMEDNGERWGEDGGDLGVFATGLDKAMNDAFEAYCCKNEQFLLEASWSFTATRNAEVVLPSVDST